MFYIYGFYVYRIKKFMNDFVVSMKYFVCMNIFCYNLDLKWMI